MNRTLYNDSAADLVSRIKYWREFIWVNILPVICFLGILANTLNVAIFRNRKKLNSTIYYYLLCHSIANLVYLLVGFLYFFGVKRFTTLNGYAAKVWDLYVLRTFSAMVAGFLMLVELHVSFKRLLIVSNYTFKRIKIRFVYSLIIIVVLAVISNLQVPFTYDIIRIRDSVYDTPPSKLGKMWLLKWWNIIAVTFRGVFAPGLLFVINLIMAIRYRTRLKKKLHLRSASSNEDSLLRSNRTAGVIQVERHHRNRPGTSHVQKTSKSITKMVICMGFLYFFSNSLIMIARTFNLYFSHYRALAALTPIPANVVLYSVHSFNILIYYHFDKRYNLEARLLLAKYLGVCSFCKSAKNPELQVSTNNNTSKNA